MFTGIFSEREEPIPRRQLRELNKDRSIVAPNGFNVKFETKFFDWLNYHDLHVREAYREAQRAAYREAYTRGISSYTQQIREAEAALREYELENTRAMWRSVRLNDNT